VENAFDEPRLLANRAATVSRGSKILCNPRRLFGDRTPQFNDQ
jgi:hypothetical protein